MSLDNAQRENAIRHNEIVKNNHAVLRRLSDIVIFLSRQELSFRGHDESLMLAMMNR